jgi:23S rRNA (uracil1939-C5)-methyltransferase
MRFNPEELKDIQILRPAAEGNCVATTPSGVVFVNFAAPGDVADLKIIRKEKKARFASIATLKEASEDRVNPFCQHFGTCGGCKWQHVTYEAQLRYKEKQVTDNLQRIGKIELPAISPIVGSLQTVEYRNRLDFGFSHQRYLHEYEMGNPAFNGSPGLGFHVPGRFDKVLDIDRCHLQHDISNQIRNETRRYAVEHNLSFYNLREHTGFLRSLIIRNSTLGDWMIILAATEENPELFALLEHLVHRFPMISSAMYVINTKLNETIFDLDVKVYSGKDHLREKLGNLLFKIGPKSFFQTSSGQAEKLYEITRDFASLTGKENVYDLYTGTGSIALFLAAGAKHVSGIEYVQQAIADAHENAKLNNIRNVSFFAGDMIQVLNENFISSQGRPDVIITDPPRAGMHPGVVQAIGDIRAPRVVYVSCNPATQARDLAMLDAIYRVEKVQPVDMFPHTHHVENVVLLNLRA